MKILVYLFFNKEWMKVGFVCQPYHNLCQNWMQKFIINITSIAWGTASDSKNLYFKALATKMHYKCQSQMNINKNYYCS